jgi:ABC-type lipoprotein export system ATPase subunit
MNEIVLKASGLVKNFRIPGHEKVEILKGVDFSVTRGEKIAIVGRSGAGKSTLLNILGGLLAPTAGTIERTDNFGFVFQAYHLMPELTVWENIILPTMSARFRKSGELSKTAFARADELLEKTGLAARKNHLPAELSGGECQRVALARALVTSPKLVLADEPTGNLDMLTGADILKILADLSQGGSTALVMVTHSTAAAAICDRVLTLEDGILK